MNYFLSLYKDENSFRAFIVALFIGGSVLFIGYQLSYVLTLFLLAYILTLLLNPGVSFLNRKSKIPRSVCALLFIFCLLIVLATVFTILSFFIHKYFVFYSSHLDEAVAFFSNWVPKTLGALSSKLHLSIQINADQIRDYLMNSLGTFTQLIVKYSLSLVDRAKSVAEIFSSIFIISILSFYFLKDWQNLAIQARKYIPTSWMDFIDFGAPILKKSFKKQIGGQTKVGLTMACLYTVGLYSIGLKACILLGLLSGLLTFIPFIGMMIAFLLVAFIALGQGLGMSSFLFIGALYFIGSSLESNFLTPKWVGDEIGLHPIWIFFSVLTALTMFGFAGGLIVMPLATFVSCSVKTLSLWVEQKDSPQREDEN